MTSKTELRRQWLNFANGFIRTVITGAITGLSTLVANGVFDMGLGWGAIGWITATSVIAHLLGWFAKQPIPDVFVVEEEPKGE